ncbi:hypothetical protein BRC64_02425 [Halobacteriales archaeon QH_10_67_22]|nr:MAG: hypothetical protein BRC64_02425 [Halobacteriales archaeon QH_10_67_22]
MTLGEHIDGRTGARYIYRDERDRDGRTTTMSEALYEQVFDETSAPMAVYDPEPDRFSSVNDAYADTLGYDRETLEERSLRDIATADAGTLSTAVRRALDGHSEVVEVELVDGSGRIREVTLELRPISDETGTRLLSTVRTVDDAEIRPARSPTEERLQVALAGTDTGVWEWDVASDEVIWTESMERLFGLDPGTFEGTFGAFARRVHPDDIPRLQDAVEAVLESGELFEAEYRIRRVDGQQRWVHARGELHGSGEDGRMVGIMTDISNRKEHEDALRTQERQYRQLVERLPNAHYTIDEDWRFTFCDEALAERLGRPVEEVEGKLLWDLVPEAKGTVVERSFERVMETGVPVNFDYQYESGDYWVAVQAYPYDDGIAAVSTDISDREEALRRILDAVPVVLYRFDSNGVFKEARGEMLRKLGLEQSDLIGENIFDAYADNERVIAAARRALDGESFRYTVTLGDITLETHYTPLYSDGEVTGVIGVSMDVTELQRQRKRMEFFNSILRHDVLNGMTVIKMRAELLADELDGHQAQYAQTILDWCETTTDVTQRVRQVIETLSTPDEKHQLEAVDVSRILQRKCRELENAYPGTAFETTVPDDVHVGADELLAEVLGNVLTNSIEHNDTDSLRVETTVDVDPETVRIRIADNGQGIDDDRKESVFHRGETSHAKESGSGFGLFFVDVMIEKYGGEVRVEDSDAGGACFVIELSRASAFE